MEKRYTITKEFVFADCLVTSSVYVGVLERFDKFIFPFICRKSGSTTKYDATRQAFRKNIR